MSFPELAYNYPDMAALLWVLADEGLEVPPPDPHEFDLPDTVGSGTITEDPAPGTGITAATTEPSTPDAGFLIATTAVSGAFGYRDTNPEPPKPPSWIDRLLGRVPS
jgi:hypothetical protein